MVLALQDLELRLSRYHSRKKGDAVLKNSVTIFLKNLHLQIQGKYHRVLFMKPSQDLVLQDGLAGSFQFLPNM